MHGIASALTLFLGVLGLLGMDAAAGERVDLELVFLADASRSIDDGEIQLQRQGYAAAITHPEVLAAIDGGYERRIAVTYVEWGDAVSQDVVVPWTIIDGAETAAEFARTLLERPRLATGPNAIGNALAAAQALIQSNEIDGTRKVIDFSADSAYSAGGVSIVEARSSAIAAGMTINGLAILCRACNGRPTDYDLEAVFAGLIVGGPGHFVITADENERFAEAVRRKLLLEVAGAPGGPAADEGEAATGDGRTEPRAAPILAEITD